MLPAHAGCWPTHCPFSAGSRALVGAEEALGGVEEEIRRVSLH